MMNGGSLMKRILTVSLQAAVLGVVVVPLIYLLLVRWQTAPGNPQVGVGSTTANGASPAPDASLAPPSYGPDDCLTIGTTFDYPAQTIENQATFSRAVFVGTVSAVGEAQWVEGKEPADDEKLGNSVFREVTASVGELAKGAGVGKSVTFRVPGGVVGCDRYFVVGFPDDAMKPGRRIAFFLGSGGLKATDGLDKAYAISAWPVGEDGKIATPEDGSVSVTELVSDVKAATR